MGLYIRLILSSIFILAVLSLIRFYWWTNDEEFCYQTKIGQEMYRLIIFYFIIVLLLNLVLETVWSQLYNHGLGSFLPAPEFDISRNTTNLIYCQVGDNVEDKFAD